MSDFYGTHWTTTFSISQTTEPQSQTEKPSPPYSLSYIMDEIYHLVIDPETIDLGAVLLHLPRFSPHIDDPCEDGKIEIVLHLCPSQWFYSIEGEPEIPMDVIAIVLENHEWVVHRILKTIMKKGIQP